MGRPGVLSNARAPRVGAAHPPALGMPPRVLPDRAAGTAGLPGDAVVATLDAVARQLRPRAATFFHVAPDGALSSSFVHAADGHAVAAVSSWKRALHGLDPLAPRELAGLTLPVVTFADVGALDLVSSGRSRAYRGIGVVNDVRMLVRDGDRIEGGVTLWRSVRSRAWTPRQLRLLGALQAFAEQAWLERAAALRAQDDGAFALLTPRERDVARLIAAGASNAEIARALHVGFETAKSHTRAILAKLGVTSRREVMLRLPGSAQPSAASSDADADVAATERLLAALLRWSQLRVDGAAAGWTLVSGRGAIVASDAASAAEDGWAVSDPSAAALGETLLSPAFLRDTVADASGADVFATAGAHPRSALVRRLAAECGWSEPIVLVLRLHGRVAGLVWVARSRRSLCDDRAAVQALRTLRPLLETAVAPLLQRALTRPSELAAPVFLRLTRRERAVARAAIGGAGNAEIARALGISEATVKTHMSRVLAKCGVRSRAQLIALAQAS
jgi:DNA-binding NarL/FixJ family response regulator